MSPSRPKRIGSSTRDGQCPSRVPGASTLVGQLDAAQRQQIEAATSEWLATTQQLSRRGRNVVTALLRNAPPQAWRHYPYYDARDRFNGVSYYYHCHPMRPARCHEHGHFHVFLRGAAQDAAAHLVAITVDAHGQPLRACATNRWVTGERLQPAEPLIAALPTLRIDTGRGRRLVDRWLAALVALFSPQIAWLLRRRDDRIAALPDRDRGLEDRRVQIWSQCRLSIVEQVAALT